MRQFYEEWEQYIQKPDSQNTEFRPSVPDEIQTDILLVHPQAMSGDIDAINCPLPTNDLSNINFNHFLSIGFTHHYEILVKTKNLEERLFYIENCATAFWSVDKLKYNLEGNLFANRGKLPNNFKTTISDTDLLGVATYKLASELPEEYRNVLPYAETLKKLL